MRRGAVRAERFGGGRRQPRTVQPGGAITVLLTAADGLDGPTAAAFGVGGDNQNLYITNAAFPFFPGPNPRRPSILRYHVGIPGKPRP